MAGKHKAAKNAKISPFMSENADCKEGRFLQVGNSLLLSAKFQSLTASAIHLYICMAMESAGRIDFVFPLKAAKKYGFSATTFRSKVTELQEQGFIKLVSSGKCIRKANQYRFDFSWKGGTG